MPSTGGWWTQYLDYVKANNVVPDIISWHSLPGDPVANVAAANTTLDSRGIAHPRPYQINEYGAPNEQNPGDGAWYIARLERAGADGLRANWAGGWQPAQRPGQPAHAQLERAVPAQGRVVGLPLLRLADRPDRVGHPEHRRTTRSPPRTSGTAKILVGGGRTTGNVAVNLQRLDTTSGIVENNQVRVVVQRIPYNNGGAVPGPVTVRNTVVTLSGNATTVNLPHTDIDDTFTITLLPPSDRRPGGSADRGRPVAAGAWTCPNSTHHQRHPGAAVGLQRPGQPALDLHLRQAAAGVRQQVPGRQRPGHRPTAPR